MQKSNGGEVIIRVARPEDAPVCGDITFRAFRTISEAHGFPPDFPSAEIATGLMQMMFSQPEMYCVVAESRGRILGSSCITERGAIAGIGPITIDPEQQNRGLGRKLMQAAMNRAKERGAAGIRLVQAAFHNRSLSLYSNLGFVVREPLACMQGRTHQRGVTGCEVRAAKLADAASCNALSLRAHGFDRAEELAGAIQRGTAIVVERGGRITGYATWLAFFGHASAETNPDLQALISSADSFGGPGILVPSRNAALFQWCLSEGLRVVQPMTLMSIGLYSEPAGAWLPSIAF
jgi:predicted N-acetyltransferase YhbS